MLSILDFFLLLSRELSVVRGVSTFMALWSILEPFLVASLDLICEVVLPLALLRLGLLEPTRTRSSFSATFLYFIYF